MTKILIELTETELSQLIESAVTKTVNQKPKTEEKLLSRKEASEYLGVTIQTLHNWVRKGTITSYQIGGKILFKFDELKNVPKAKKQVEF